jgi:hypothetical protein
MKEQFIKKHFATSSAKRKALLALGIRAKKTHAEFLSILMQLSYSKLKSII